MRVELNCHRAGHAPGDVVDLAEDAALALVTFGGAYPVADDEGQADEPTQAQPQATEPAPVDEAAAEPDGHAEQLPEAEPE